MSKKEENLERLVCQLGADAMWGGKRNAPNACEKVKN